MIKTTRSLTAVMALLLALAGAAGVKVATVEKRPVTQTIRMLGRVAVDETRVYRINSTVDGWITKTSPKATGSLVRKNEALAGFYSSEFLSVQTTYIYNLSSNDRVRSQDLSLPGREAQLQQFKNSLQQLEDNLRNLGMGNPQIEEINRTREYQQNIDIFSPADGIILVRNVSMGLRFERGTELYRIADLSHVWILADVFENEAQFLTPNITAKVALPNQNRTFTAKVSNAVPQFDLASRTLKIRLEVDNPHIVLKPDMFVDVEFPVKYEPGIAVPVDAVVDTGLRKVVFVDKVAPSKVPFYVALADVLVSPRLSGTNTPLKIYQYLRSGKPIVATNLLTHTQVLDSSVAELTDATADAFGAGILRVLRDREHGAALSRAAQALADTRYTYEAYVEKTREALRPIAGRPASEAA